MWLSLGNIRTRFKKQMFDVAGTDSFCAVFAHVYNFLKTLQVKFCTSGGVFDISFIC